MGRIIGKAVLCAAAGFLAWLLTAGIFPADSSSPDWGRAEGILLLLACALIAGTAGVVQGLQQGGKVNLAMSGGISLLLGVLAGMFGVQLGGGIAVMLFGYGWPELPGFDLRTVLGRIIVLSLLGLGLGAGIGAGLRSKRGIVSGAMGGLAGGAAAGLLFDLIGEAVGATILAAQGLQQGEIGGPSRAVTFALLGFSVGLFTALFEYWSRQAWLRLMLGRNEGKEWPVDRSPFSIGKDERADLPLFGDPNLPRLAAVIVQQGRQYVLQDPQSPIGVGLNGMRVTQPVMLNPGDTIQVGHLQLQFLMKAGAVQRMNEARGSAFPVGGQAAPYGQPGMTQPGMNQPAAGGFGGPAPGAQPMPTMPGGFGQAGAMPLAGQPNGSQQTVAYTPAPAASQQTVMSPAGAMTLVLLSGPMAGQRIPLDGQVEIGREGAQVRLAHDNQASRRHAMVMAAGGTATLSDLGSTNGTFVNGQKVASAALKQGDVLKVGSTEMRVE